MNVNSLYLILFLLAGLFVLRRVMGPLQRLEEYSRQQKERMLQEMAAMRREHARLSSKEALEPVKAGILELFELHGLPQGLYFHGTADCLYISGPGLNVRIGWLVPRVHLRSTNTNIEGQGHWELRFSDGFFEKYTDLSPLMGRLAGLLREMADQMPRAGAG